MSTAKITLYGMYRYMSLSNDDLFKYLKVPEGIDKQTLIDNIILRGAEFEVLYSDPHFFQDSIKVWSNKWQHTFERWVKALSIDYNPLDNYDRIEESTDTANGSGKNSNLNKVSAFNSSSFENDSTQSSDTEFENKNVHTARLHGNIGVTTSQQMLEAELTVAEWNIYEHITDIFVEQFCLMVY